MSTMNIAKPKRRTVWDFIKQQPLGFIGLILILIMSIAAIFSPEVAPYPVSYTHLRAHETV